MRKEEEKRGAGELIVSAAIGGLFATVLALILLFLFAIFIAAEILPESMIDVMVIISAFLAATAGASVSAKRLGNSPLPAGICGALCFFALILLVSAFRGDNELLGIMTVKLAVCALAGGALGGVLGARRKKRRKVISRRHS